MHPEHQEALLLRDAMIAGLAGAAADVAVVGRELYKATVLTKVQRVVLYTTLALLVVTLSGLFVVALGNRQNGADLRDCTIPGGVCYERNQANTGKAIKILIDQNEAAAFCSPREKTAKDFQACIAGYVRGIAGAQGK